MMNRPEHDLLGNFFKIQRKYPAKNDWINTVKEDLKLVKINLDLDEIKEKSKESFSNLVKVNVREAAFQDLQKMKNEHSKMSNISYTKLELQSYFKSKNIYPADAKNIFKFRTRMANVKTNFRSQYQGDLKCVDCDNNPLETEANDDSQEHLLYHSDINKNSLCAEKLQDIYLQLFQVNDQDKLTVVKLMESVLKKRPETCYN